MITLQLACSARSSPTASASSLFDPIVTQTHLLELLQRDFRDAHSTADYARTLSFLDSVCVPHVINNISSWFSRIRILQLTWTALTHRFAPTMQPPRVRRSTTQDRTADAGSTSGEALTLSGSAELRSRTMSGEGSTLASGTSLASTVGIRQKADTAKATLEASLNESLQRVQTALTAISIGCGTAMLLEVLRRRCMWVLMRGEPRTDVETPTASSSEEGPATDAETSMLTAHSPVGLLRGQYVDRYFRVYNLLKLVTGPVCEDMEYKQAYTPVTNAHAEWFQGQAPMYTSPEEERLQWLIRADLGYIMHLTSSSPQQMLFLLPCILQELRQAIAHEPSTGSPSHGSSSSGHQIGSFVYSWSIRQRLWWVYLAMREAESDRGKSALVMCVHDLLQHSRNGLGAFYEWLLLILGAYTNEAMAIDEAELYVLNSLGEVPPPAGAPDFRRESILDPEATASCFDSLFVKDLQHDRCSLFGLRAFRTFLFAFSLVNFQMRRISLRVSYSDPAAAAASEPPPASASATSDETSNLSGVLPVIKLILHVKREALTRSSHAWTRAKPPPLHGLRLLEDIVAVARPDVARRAANLIAQLYLSMGAEQWLIQSACKPIQASLDALSAAADGEDAPSAATEASASGVNSIRRSLMLLEQAATCVSASGGVGTARIELPASIHSANTAPAAAEDPSHPLVDEVDSRTRSVDVEIEVKECAAALGRDYDPAVQSRRTVGTQYTVLQRVAQCEQLPIDLRVSAWNVLQTLPSDPWLLQQLVADRVDWTALLHGSSAAQPIGGSRSGGTGREAMIGAFPVSFRTLDVLRTVVWAISNPDQLMDVTHVEKPGWKIRETLTESRFLLECVATLREAVCEQQSGDSGAERSVSGAFLDRFLRSQIICLLLQVLCRMDDRCTLADLTQVLNPTKPDGTAWIAALPLLRRRADAALELPGASPSVCSMTSLGLFICEALLQAVDTLTGAHRRSAVIAATALLRTRLIAVFGADEAAASETIACIARAGGHAAVRTLLRCCVQTDELLPRMIGDLVLNFSKSRRLRRDVGELTVATLQQLPQLRSQCTVTGVQQLLRILVAIAEAADDDRAASRSRSDGAAVNPNSQWLLVTLQETLKQWVAHTQGVARRSGQLVTSPSGRAAAGLDKQWRVAVVPTIEVLTDLLRETGEHRAVSLDTIQFMTLWAQANHENSFANLCDAPDGIWTQSVVLCMHGLLFAVPCTQSVMAHETCEVEAPPPLLRRSSSTDRQKGSFGVLRGDEVPGSTTVLSTPLCTSIVERKAAFHLLFMLLQPLLTSESIMEAIQLKSGEESGGVVGRKVCLGALMRRIEWLCNTRGPAPTDDPSWLYEAAKMTVNETGYVGATNDRNTCYANSILQQLFMFVPFRELITHVNFYVDTIHTKTVKETLHLAREDELQALNQPRLPTFVQTDDERAGQWWQKHEAAAGLVRVQHTPPQTETKTTMAPNARLFLELQKTFLWLTAGDVREYNPSALVDALSHINIQFDVREQNDASECFEGLLDRLESHLGDSPLATQLRQLYMGTLVDETVRETGHVTVRECPFVAQLVPLRSTLIEGLQSLVAGSVMQGDDAILDEASGQRVAALKRTVFTRTPPMLVLHLNRKKHDYAAQRISKVNDYMSFPHELDMSEFSAQRVWADEVGTVPDKLAAACPRAAIPLRSPEMLAEVCPEMLTAEQARASGAKPAQPHQNNMRYQLRGVVVHSGQADSGHYYSFIRESESGHWLQFNDSNVTEVPESSLPGECFGGKQLVRTVVQGRPMVKEQDIVKNALLLVYQRCDIQNTPDTLHDLSSSCESSVDHADTEATMVDTAPLEGFVPQRNDSTEDIVVDTGSTAKLVCNAAGAAGTGAADAESGASGAAAAARTEECTVRTTKLERIRRLERHERTTAQEVLQSTLAVIQRTNRDVARLQHRFDPALLQFLLDVLDHQSRAWTSAHQSYPELNRQLQLVPAAAFPRVYPVLDTALHTLMNTIMRWADKCDVGEDAVATAGVAADGGGPQQLISAPLFAAIDRALQANPHVAARFLYELCDDGNSAVAHIEVPRGMSGDSPDTSSEIALPSNLSRPWLRAALVMSQNDAAKTLLVRLIVTAMEAVEQIQGQLLQQELNAFQTLRSEQAHAASLARQLRLSRRQQSRLTQKLKRQPGADIRESPEALEASRQELQEELDQYEAQLAAQQLDSLTVTDPPNLRSRVSTHRQRLRELDDQIAAARPSESQRQETARLRQRLAAVDDKVSNLMRQVQEQSAAVSEAEAIVESIAPSCARVMGRTWCKLAAPMRHHIQGAEPLLSLASTILGRHHLWGAGVFAASDPVAVIMMLYDSCFSMQDYRLVRESVMHTTRCGFTLLPVSLRSIMHHGACLFLASLFVFVFLTLPWYCVCICLATQPDAFFDIIGLGTKHHMQMLGDETTRKLNNALDGTNWGCITELQRDNNNKYGQQVAGEVIAQITELVLQKAISSVASTMMQDERLLLSYGTEHGGSRGQDRSREGGGGGGGGGDDDEVMRDGEAVQSMGESVLSAYRLDPNLGLQSLVVARVRYVNYTWRAFVGQLRSAFESYERDNDSFRAWILANLLFHPASPVTVWRFEPSLYPNDTFVTDCTGTSRIVLSLWNVSFVRAVVIAHLPEWRDRMKGLAAINRQHCDLGSPQFEQLRVYRMPCAVEQEQTAVGVVANLSTEALVNACRFLTVRERALQELKTVVAEHEPGTPFPTPKVEPVPGAKIVRISGFTKSFAWLNGVYQQLPNTGVAFPRYSRRYGGQPVHICRLHDANGQYFWYFCISITDSDFHWGSHASHDRFLYCRMFAESMQMTPLADATVDVIIDAPTGYLLPRLVTEATRVHEQFGDTSFDGVNVEVLHNTAVEPAPPAVAPGTRITTPTRGRTVPVGGLASRLGGNLGPVGRSVMGDSDSDSDLEQPMDVDLPPISETPAPVSDSQQSESIQTFMDFTATDAATARRYVWFAHRLFRCTVAGEA